MRVVIVIVMIIVLIAIPIAGCGNGGGEAVPFSIQVIPQQMDDSVPEQICVFLVTTQSDDAVKAINISASVYLWQ